jgi:hypothetical protein
MVDIGLLKARFIMATSYLGHTPPAQHPAAGMHLLWVGRVREQDIFQARATRKWPLEMKTDGGVQEVRNASARLGSTDERRATVV